MKLIVGLGNPGEKYSGNRHNIGFMAVDEIARGYSFAPWKKRFQGYTAEGQIGLEKCILLKPSTYMNESGRAVGEAMRFYKLPLGDVIVIHDEIDLKPGVIRVKKSGGNAGHNGLKSISAHAGNDYARVRLGIDHPGDKALVANYVLQDFAKSDRQWLMPVLEGVARGMAKLVEGSEAAFLGEAARGRKPSTPAAKLNDAAPARNGNAPASADEMHAAREAGPVAQHASGQHVEEVFSEQTPVPHASEPVAVVAHSSSDEVHAALVAGPTVQHASGQHVEEVFSEQTPVPHACEPVADVAHSSSDEVHAALVAGPTVQQASGQHVEDAVPEQTPVPHANEPVADVAHSSSDEVHAARVAGPTVQQASGQHVEDAVSEQMPLPHADEPVAVVAHSSSDEVHAAPVAAPAAGHASGQHVEEALSEQTLVPHANEPVVDGALAAAAAHEFELFHAQASEPPLFETAPEDRAKEEDAIRGPQRLFEPRQEETSALSAASREGEGNFFMRWFRKRVRGGTK